jgi:hypothetical protein
LLLDELRRGRKGEAEVVIGAATGMAGETADESPALPLLSGVRPAAAGPGSSVEVVRTLSVAHDRYLDDHRVDGKPVLPFAVAMELMAELAAVASPTGRVAGLREIRLLNGVSVEDDGTTVRVTATPRPGGSELDAEIAPIESPRAHYRAIVQMGEADRDGAQPATLPSLKPFPRSVQEAYSELLFHGPMFQAITAIEGMDERGATSTLRPSAAAGCVAEADGLEWLLDPILLDAALQVQVLWARLEWDVTLLPAQIAGYRWAAAPAAGEQVRHELRVRPDSKAPMCHCDHWFYGADGRLLATLQDVVGVGTQALNRLAATSA